jgi:hypothetical protein
LPKKEPKQLTGACFVRVSGLSELGRLSCALERAPFPLFATNNGKSVRIAAQADLFMGIPIFYYAESEKGGEFLAYRNSGEIEETVLVDSPVNPSYIYAPLINVVKMPRVLESASTFEDKFAAVEVENLPSLVKVAAYKMLFEEPPLPLFAFKNGTSWVIGTFARIDDYEEASLFFYTRSEKEPSSGFVRYATSKIGDTAFSRRTDEHGFIYVKVIKLAEKHPLVEF